MPHLETTYLFNQITWCILIFIIIYVTIQKKILNINESIISKRKNIMGDYIYMGKTLLILCIKLENKIKKFKKIQYNIFQKQNIIIENFKKQQKYKIGLDIKNIEKYNNIQFKEKFKKTTLNHKLNNNEYIKGLKKTIKSYILFKKC